MANSLEYLLQDIKQTRMHVQTCIKAYYLNLLKFCFKKFFPVLLLKRVLIQDKLRQEATDLSLVISNNKINYFQQREYHPTLRVRPSEAG